MDYHWAVQQQPSAHRLSSTPASLVHVSPPTGYKERVKTSLPLHEYSLINFFTYAVYPALYIAGPIMSFNDFTWQIKRPSATPPRALFSYALRFLACILTMEVVLHYMYVVAIKDAGAWEGDTPAELSMIGLWNLIVVWLKVRSFTNALIQDCFADILCENEKKKLLVPWRFFRLWALADGIDPPENMVRCMANNYSTLGFWRSWHRSYNLWTVR
jgi:D-alanyl-lipoteichoic acid acyltransferase DltB (MBOAT superfamily)